MRRMVRGVAVLVVFGLLVPGAAVAAVLGSILFLPLPASLPEPREFQARGSRIYDTNGQLIAELRRFDLTVPITPEDIPQVLVDAVIASEDRRFYDHNGIDVRGTVRALWADVRNGAAVQGGSTITQQLVKNAYLGPERSLSRKLREAVLARQVDRELTKDEILFEYLDTIYLGEGAYGVGAAAQTYFRKPLRDLSLSEAALLAGLIPAPSRYEPRGNPARAEQRRLLVLQAMREVGSITPEQQFTAAALHVYSAVDLFGPPSVPSTIVWPRDEPPTDFPYFVDYVERYLSFRYGDDVVYREGLDIYTTIDPRLQLLAEQSVAEALEGTSAPLEMSLVSVEPATGYVKALVGGRDIAAGGGQVNIALGRGGGGTGRQAGSTFKPFVLATALTQGISVRETYSGASPLVIGQDDFENFGGASYGRVDLRTATVKSINTVFVQLCEDVGVQATVDTARALGAETVPRDDAGLAVALGSLEVSPLDMAAAYGTFAALGERAPVTPIRTVLTSAEDPEDRELLEDNTERERVRAIDPQVADTMNDVLSGVFGGTAAGHDIGRPAAGKTGTSQNSADAWFVGYTPNLSTSVWLGYRDGQRSLRGIGGFDSVTGGTIPAGTWERYMRAALDGVAVAEFGEPPPVAEVAEAPTSAEEQARQGFELRGGREVTGTDVDDLVEEVDGPSVDAPPPPTTVPPPTTTTLPEVVPATTVPENDEGSPPTTADPSAGPGPGPGPGPDPDPDPDQDPSDDGGLGDLIPG